MRFLTLNTKGLDPRKIKNERFISSIEKNQIDMMLLNEVNVKQTPVNVDTLEYKFKALGREISVIMVDSLIWSVIKDNYLVGGTVTAIKGKFCSLIEE